MASSTVCCAYAACSLRPHCNRYTSHPGPTDSVIDGQADCRENGDVYFVNYSAPEGEKTYAGQLTLGDVLFNARQDRTAA